MVQLGSLHEPHESATKMIIPFLFVTSFIWFVYKKYKTSCYPPGPFPLPLIGNLHLLRKDIHLSMDRLSKQYGKMFTLWMADIPFIVITDYELAKKVCLTRKFADRLPLYVGGELYSRGAKDIIMGDYTPALQLHRKLAQSAFQMFGGHMEALEGRILTNVENLLLSCQKNTNNPRFELFQDIEYTFFNVMSTIVFGDSVSKDSALFIKIRDAVFFMMQSGVTLSMVNFYPVLRHLPNVELKRTNKVVQERDTVLRDVFTKVKGEYNVESQPTNYIEALLKSKSLSAAEEKGGGDIVFSQDHMEMNIYDMFLAGVEVVAVTAMWSVLFLVKWPEVQQKCHQHLDRVVGSKTADNKELNTRVKLEHKKDLPYFTAVIYETLRLASTLPFGVFHKARENTTLNEYNLKKGTAVMINLWSIHHDESYFKDPMLFKPERFLDEDGALLPASKIKNFLAFSIGPRQCIGQQVANAELFLFLTNLLYNFEVFNSPANKKELSTTGKTKITHAPLPFAVILKQK